MKHKIYFKGQIKKYIHLVIYLGIILLLLDLGLLLIDYKSALFLFVFVVFYFLVVLTLYFYFKPIIIRELVSFATQYGQIQKSILKELELPYCLLDEAGKIIWSNNSFIEVINEKKCANKSITSYFSSITLDKLPISSDENNTQCELLYHGGKYSVKCKKIPLKGMVDSSSLIEVEGEYDGFLIAMYLFDETALHLALQEVEDQSLAVGMIYLDNYEEALETVEEVRRSLLSALIDRKVNKYISSTDGIVKKIEKDKYLVVMRKKSVMFLEENRFELLEEVKTVNIGNEMAVTLSIGIGSNGLTYAQNYEFARNAIDLALGRGGDQAVIKTPESITYYGGKSQQIEKNTRVKARVKAHALKEIISDNKDKVIVMGHQMQDVDSFGAAIGIYRIAKVLDRKAHIVLNEATTSVQPMIDLFKGNAEYDNDMIVNSTEAIELADDTTVLVVVDVNKASITECPELLKICKSIVVLDHHRQGADLIENATLSYIEPFASSTCEMVSEILQYTCDNIKIRVEEADCLYAGIVIDTNNFMAKAGVRTFEAAAFLRRNGADVTRVRKLFREDVDEYKAKADAVSQAQIHREYFAISVCSGEGMASPTIIGAQAANELLNIKNIKASFILTEHQGRIFVSARSIDEINVQIIMERLGGGGHLNIAGCQIDGMNMAEAIGAVKGTLDIMLEEGAI